MVKVVGIDESAILRSTCRNCASILEYTLSEVRLIKYGYDYRGEGSMGRGFKCPQCNHNVFTDKKR